VFRTNGRNFRSNYRNMKNKDLSAGKEKKESFYKHEEPKSSIVSEPDVAYGNRQDPEAMRTIVLMGMDGKRDFAHIKNENDFISIIRTGIPKQAMTHLMDIADISLTEMASIIHTSDRTLRRYTPQQKLSQDQSERMVEMARLYSRGEEVFGTMEKFKEWMDTSLLPFGNKKPKAFLDTSLGIAMIMNELGRIEHGIFA
jgi:putative toxin-antitoxin system antitoxin component (TIGR02293 family)